MRNLSIKTKITIWYTVFLLIITGGFLAIFVYTGNERASEAAKTRLMDSVADASEEIENFGGDFIIDNDLNFYEEGVYISIYDADGELIEGRRPAELATLPTLDDKSLMKMHDEKGEAWYLYDSLFKVDGRYIWVRGIVKDSAEQSAFSFILRVSVFAFPGLVLLAALGGYFITRRAFQPVRGILDTVENISEDGDLSRRIEVDAKRAKDEIHNLAGAFNGMFDKLQASFEKEKQFTSDVSHELRTPLAVIISQSDYAREDAAYREKALEVINQEARRMAGLVNRLLTLARSDSGKLKLEKEIIDFSEMCEMVALQQGSAAEQRQIRIETDIHPDVKIVGDEAMLIRVLLNLMENAVKYGREDGWARLSLKMQGEYAVCSVKDNGIGIGPDHLERIWERFYRVDVSRSEEGSGLGLSMVSALVKAHGGHMEVSSQLGEGSCFTAYLPLASNLDEKAETEKEKRIDQQMEEK